MSRTTEAPSDVSPPAGTVTFLFTGGGAEDERTADASRTSAQRDILRGALERRGAFVFKTVGEAVLAAFSSAPQAVAAALAAQIAVAEAFSGPARGRPGTRMALHTGVAEARGGDYFGPTLNRVARILSTAQPGQVLLSLATAELASEQLPEGASLRDLGIHRLRDLQRAEHLYQLVHPGLPSDFPALRTASTLPTSATPLVGRHAEIEALVELGRSEDVRLVTLTGPGGIGKSRLAVEAATQLQGKFADGLWVANFAAVSDPALVAATIAHALNVRESAGVSPFLNLKGYLRDKHALLLLDSFERVAAAGPLIADLLATAPRLMVLVTSRALLRVRGEYEFPVPPLAIPPETAPVSLEEADRYPAVHLFVERAAAASPGFELTADNVNDVVAICQRLDGLPLALELAAARVRLLPLGSLLSRLSRRLQLLTGGAKDLPERQRTLRGAIDWGHDLLSTPEQMLFRRLGVFVDGFTLDAAEAVAAADGDDSGAGDAEGGDAGGVAALGLDLLDGLDSLLGKSFLYQVPFESTEPRFAMLQTLREYAVERLAASPDQEAIDRRHAAFYLALAERAKPRLRLADQAQWLERLEAEHANLRAALRWAEAHVAVDTELRLCAALGPFWRVHGHFSEGGRWLDRALALSAGQRTALRAEVVDRASYLLRARGDYATAETLQREALSIWEELGDKESHATALKALSSIRYDRGDLDGATRLLHESLAARGPSSDQRMIAETYNNLGVNEQRRGDLDDAAEHYKRALATFEQVGDAEGIARVHLNIGSLSLQRGQSRMALEALREAVRGFHALGSTWDLVDCLDDLGTALAALGRLTAAGTVFGAGEALREALNAARPEPEQGDYDRNVQAARQAGDPVRFDAAWDNGRTLTVEQVVDYALAQQVPRG